MMLIGTKFSALHKVGPLQMFVGLSGAWAMLSLFLKGQNTREKPPPMEPHLSSCPQSSSAAGP